MHQFLPTIVPYVSLIINYLIYEATMSAAFADALLTFIYDSAYSHFSSADSLLLQAFVS